MSDFKEGDIVRFKSSLNEYIEIGRKQISLEPSWIIPFEENWYMPVIKEAKRKLTYEVDGFIQHQVMGECCYLYNQKDNKTFRVPVGWVENV